MVDMWGHLRLTGYYVGVMSVTFGSSLENIGPNAFRDSTLAGNLDLSVATNLIIATVRAPPPLPSRFPPDHPRLLSDAYANLPSTCANRATRGPESLELQLANHAALGTEAARAPRRAARCRGSGRGSRAAQT